MPAVTPRHTLGDAGKAARHGAPIRALGSMGVGSVARRSAPIQALGSVGGAAAGGTRSTAIRGAQSAAHRGAPVAALAARGARIAVLAGAVIAALGLWARFAGAREEDGPSSPASWVADVALADHEAYLGGQLATLDGATYLVRSDRCGGWGCPEDAGRLYWSRRTPTGWTAPRAIPDRRTGERVSLAAFDGALYMVHTALDAGEPALWLSRFDPAGETWSAARRLTYPTFAGPPAIAAFDGALVFVGIDEDCRMWTASMAPGEALSAPRRIAAHASCSRPSLAVLGDRLYAAHRAGASGELQLSHRGAGLDVSWSTARHVRGPDGAPLRSIDPALAAANNSLHLLFRTPESDQVWWTSFDGCVWRSVALPGHHTTTAPSLAATGASLVLATTSDLTAAGFVETRAIAVTEIRLLAPALDTGTCGPPARAPSPGRRA